MFEAVDLVALGEGEEGGRGEEGGFTKDVFKSCGEDGSTRKERR